MTLLAIPVEIYPTERQALAVAGRQARRHAAAGTWVLVTGEGTALLYVDDRYFVLCEHCRRWMPPRRRGNVCGACRAAAEASAAQSSAAAQADPRSSASRSAAPRRKRSRSRASAEQLVLPEMLEFTEEAAPG